VDMARARSIGPKLPKVIIGIYTNVTTINQHWSSKPSRTPPQCLATELAIGIQCTRPEQVTRRPNRKQPFQGLRLQYAKGLSLYIIRALSACHTTRNCRRNRHLQNDTSFRSVVACRRQGRAWCHRVLPSMWQDQKFACGSADHSNLGRV
jgi:hypothetical protein